MDPRRRRVLVPSLAGALAGRHRELVLAAPDDPVRTTQSGGSARDLHAVPVALARALPRRLDELAEERRRPGRAGLELGMELRGDEPGMVGQLHDLHQSALL